LNKKIIKNNTIEEKPINYIKINENKNDYIDFKK
jgi:hypothetical protein